MHIENYHLESGSDNDTYLFKAKSGIEAFPIRATAGEAVNDLVQLGADGYVYRYLKTNEQQIPGSFESIWCTAGLAAVITIHTPITDADKVRRTSQEWRDLGVVVKAAYVGPTTLEQAESQANDFQKALPGTYWVVIKLGNGYQSAELKGSVEPRKEFFASIQKAQDSKINSVKNMIAYMAQRGHYLSVQMLNWMEITAIEKPIFGSADSLTAWHMVVGVD